MSIDFHNIRSNYPIVEIAKRIGIDVLSNNTCKCVFHNDNNPSMSFDLRSNRYKCFACDAKGTNIDLVMNLLGYDIKKACEFITGNSFLDHASNHTIYYKNKHITSNTTEIQTIENIDYHNIYNSLLHNEYTEYSHYLKERGITIAHLENIECRVIKNSRALEHKLIKTYGQESLYKAGLYSKNNNFLFQNNFLLIPYFDKNNKIHTIKARDTQNKRFANCNGRELILYGINRIYNDCTLIVDGKAAIISHKNINSVYITESEIDALSFMQIGLVAVACSGSSWNSSYTKELLQIKDIVVATDVDEAGLRLRESIVLNFYNNRKQISILDIKAYRNCKDINDLLKYSTNPLQRYKK